MTPHCLAGGPSAALLSADGFFPEPHAVVRRAGAPDTIAGWKALADGLLTDQACAFHRNVEISSRYAWLYQHLPDSFKWAGMAAIASHHVRLALFPLRLDTDRTGYVDLAHSLTRKRLLMIEDVNAIRATNNAIFDDIFWVHLAYAGTANGMDRLRALLRTDGHYASILAGLEAVEEGHHARADDLVWKGNLQLLEHEQRALVQPHFDRLSCRFARLVSLGSATSFEVRGTRHVFAYFTSFYLYSLTRGMPQTLRARSWPRMTRYDDRWGWIEASVVPAFRRFAADAGLIDATLRRILRQARTDAAMPCVLPSTHERGAFPAG